MTDVFTVTDVVWLLKQLDGKDAMTARAVRYYARTGMVEPHARIPGARGARLYTLVDVALLRLALFLRVEKKLPERAVWGVLVYRGDEIRRQLETGRGTIVIDDPATVSPGQEQSDVELPIWIPVMLVLGGLKSAAYALRRQHPKVWTGLNWLTPAEAAEQVPMR